MVDDLEITKRAQATNAGAMAYAHSASGQQPQSLSQAISDAVILSAQARSVLDQLRDAKTVAEAWLDHVTAPPDLTKPASPSPQADLGGGGEEANAELKQAMDVTLGDIGWLFDAMSPPKVASDMVAKVLAERMAADRVGVAPPLAEVTARARQAGSAPALYVENLSVTVQRGRVTEASVERVALTTVNASVRDRVAGKDRPLVLDMGGELKDEQAAVEAKGEAPAQGAAAETASEGARATETRHALLILRQGGTRLPEGTLRVKLDALLPLV